MKKKVTKNTNGIVICDSIVMSVKKKRPDLRSVEAVGIALIGYISAAMAFLTMFDFNYSRIALLLSAFVFASVYITLALIGKKGAWIAAATVIPAMLFAVRIIDYISLGYKYMYNVIYKTSFHTQISYYKHLKPDMERISLTAFFVFVMWILAIVIFIFTVYRPNAIPPLIVTFPMVEIGLYNGIKISVFWGILLVAYWLALFAMTATDIGEYSGGNSGFVRKNNLFFPKRHMRLKVTEKCGLLIISEVAVVALISTAFLKVTHYQRSDEINQKRTAVRDAVNSFTLDDFAGSISNLTSAFGLDFEYETHELGNVDKLKYKDRTDLVVTISKNTGNAVYLKDYTGSVYNNNKWDSLPESAYNSKLFDDFSKYECYPQTFPFMFNSMNIKNPEDLFEIEIDSKLRNTNRTFAPYGASPSNINTYKHDSDVSSKTKNAPLLSYQFLPVNCRNAAMALSEPSRSILDLNAIEDNKWRETLLGYCDSHGYDTSDIYMSFDSELNLKNGIENDNPDILLTAMIEEEYEDFVYDNYLDYPDTPDLEEVRKKMADVLAKRSETGSPAAAQLLRQKGKPDKDMTAAEKLEIMDALRDAVSSQVEYSLTPGRTPGSRDFVNYFLLENHKGYCTHYASSGVILARMAGIPARYATGYVIVTDDYNSDNLNSHGKYTINVKDNRSHAWMEIYLNGYGWVPYEFTAGYSDSTIDTTPTTATTSSSTTTASSTETTSASSSDTETSSEKSENAAASSSTLSTATTAVTSNSASTSLPAKRGGKKGLSLPEETKFVIMPLCVLAIAIAAVLIRRRLILSKRKKNFTEGSSAKRMRYIYGFAEKLLALQQIERGDASFVQFADNVDKQLGGEYYPSGGFAMCTDSALKAAFSETAPTDTEVEQCRVFAEEFAKNVYEKSGRIRKIYLKFINVIF